MGALQDFLDQNIVNDITKDVIVSERFKDKNGKILKFKIKVMSEEELNSARKAATKILKKGKTDFNTMIFNRIVCINNTIEPDFKNSESIKKTGSITPEQYLTRVMLPGEIDRLVKEILELSGFSDDMDELVDDVKN